MKWIRWWRRLRRRTLRAAARAGSSDRSRRQLRFELSHVSNARHGPPLFVVDLHDEFVLSHPCRKNKDASRMGHPFSCGLMQLEKCAFTTAGRLSAGGRRPCGRWGDRDGAGREWNLWRGWRVIERQAEFGMPQERRRLAERLHDSSEVLRGAWNDSPFFEIPTRIKLPVGGGRVPGGGLRCSVCAARRGRSGRAGEHAGGRQFCGTQVCGTQVCGPQF